MYHPNIRSVHSPLTPIPPMSQSSFDFSPSAINRCLEASKSVTPSVLKPRRTYTPTYMDMSPPDISPIDYLPSSVNRKHASPNSTLDSNSSMKADESVTFEYDADKFSNISNINNRQLNISTVLDDLGLTQYKMLFETEEIDLMAFLLMNENDLQTIGVKDPNHRVIFTSAIEKYCGIL